MNIIQSSGEYTCEGARYMKNHLAKRAGIGCNSTRLAAIVSKHLHSKAIYEQYLAEQGALENWCDFPSSCSPYQVQRVLNGQSACLALCVAVGKAFTEVTSLPAPAIATDPLPHMQTLTEELRQWIALAHRQQVNDLLDPREFHYARFVPLKDKDIEAVTVELLAAAEGEAAINAVFRDKPIQVGLIVPTDVSGQHSVVYAPQPYRWTGAEVTVGRKKIRSIQLDTERVRGAIAEYLSSATTTQQHLKAAS